jgi:hypothetical protein
MKQPLQPKKTVYFGEINVNAPLPVLLLKSGAGIAASVLLFLLIFWLYFGELPPFAWGFAIFLVLLQVLIILGLRLRNTTEFHAEKELRNDWLDRVGAWWLMACAFGAFFGWICGVVAPSFPAYMTAFHIARIVSTILLPVITLTPNLRYIGGRAALVQVPIAFCLTLLPVISGLGSVIALLK